jgi:hypothetical protein
MMTRICDGCKRPIEQEDNEYLELQIRILSTTKGDGQDAIEHSYGDFCDTCLSSGVALSILLKNVGWKLEVKVITNDIL